MSDINLNEMQFDANNLYKEETITDLKVGNIRVLTPIKKDGSIDETRDPIYTASTNIMTPGGALPINGEIEAENLEQAIAKFPDAIDSAIKKLQDDMIRMQQEQASKIVTPDDFRGKNDLII